MTERTGPSAVGAEAADPSVTLVHDYLTQRGGAERVVLAMLDAFPQARLHTSLFEPARTYPEFARADVRVGRLNRVGVLRRHHRAALLTYPFTFGRLCVDDEVTVCSSSGWAHSVQTTGAKVVYCHNPARWLYQTDEYFGSGARATRAAFSPAAWPLRRWDARAAATADVYLANSSVVRDRIRATYGIDAEVLPPPPAVDATGERTPIDGIDPGFLLCVSRLMRYKHVPSVIAAARRAGLRIVVVGQGPDERAVRHQLHDGAILIRRVDDAQLRWLYSTCTAVVSAADEDYGLTPLEGAMFGAPCVVPRGGGFLDTVIEGETGIFFDVAEPTQMARAMADLATTSWSEERIRLHAATFSRERFIARLREVVRDVAARRSATVNGATASSSWSSSSSWSPGAARS